MSSIVTGILSSTLGLLWNKARDKAAKKLRDGDITDAKIRELLVRELNDIRTKIDGLSRKDLLSSYSFLHEGVELLNDCLEKPKDEQKAAVNEDQNDGEVKWSTTASIDKFDILNDALKLAEVMKKLKLVSSQTESVKDRFKRAREEATHAFCNEALSIQERIFAAKLRVVSEILECLESPDTAVTSCVLFLGKLHDLPSVREIFSVYLGRRVKSMVGKAARTENVKSIMMINCVLYQFVLKFSTKYYSADDLISGMTFHFVLSKIMVLSPLFRERSYFLHGYSQTDEHHSSIFLGKWNETESFFSRIVSHPKGLAAFVTPAFILYL